MTYFDKLREKNKVIAFLVKLQNSSFYPIFFAIFCFISGVNGKEVYLPCIWMLTLTVVFAGLFSDDFKVFLVPALLIYYAIGFDVPDNYFEPSGTFFRTPPFDESSIPHFIICVALILIVLLYRIIASKKLKEIILKKGLFFRGIIAIDVALLFNGAFSPSWQPINILYGLMIGCGLTMFYCIFLVLLSHSKDAIAYICKTMVCAGMVVTAQTAVMIIRMIMGGTVAVYTVNDGWISFNRLLLSLAWGLPTITGAVVALAIPAALYLARNRRFPALSCSLAVIFLITTFLIDTRSALIFGGIAFVIGFIICCFKNKNKITNRVFAISIISIVAIAFTAILIIKKNPLDVIGGLFESLRLDFLLRGELSFGEIFGSRAEMWKNGFNNFLSAPIFGVGFSVGRALPADITNPNLFDAMHHNVIIEFLTSTGLVGILAFIFHLKHGIEILFRKFSADRILILLIPILILSMSLLDNFFFYPNFSIIYATFLACAELMLEERRSAALNNLNKIKKGEKPKVAFAFVEAGKGHIVPTRTICDVFKQKYGDKVEVIESNFFTETDNPDMQKTEKLFKKAVEQQNRSPILSILCRIGNSIAGNAFALYALLSLSISGRKTNPLAVKHIEELDANVIFTAHWCIPYYVNQMRSPHPYTISFCPDALSNGAFDVDSNNFLISNSIGYKKALRYRMYAGGNISQVPFPIRTETEKYRDPSLKAEIRQQLGIPKDEFVVTLCDGGYGMARLEKTVKHLLKTDKPLTIIALCGTNKTLYEKLCEITPPKNIRLIPVSFTNKVLEYICIADVFVGKSGANSMAEPAALSVPIIITKCITYVERSIKNYYVHSLKGGMYIPNSKRAAKKVISFIDNKKELEKLRKNLTDNPQARYDAEATADLIWQRVLEMQE